MNLYSFWIPIFVETKLIDNMFYKFLARLNKVVLPSFTKRGLDPAKASKLQLAIIGWRYYITKKSLDD